MIGQVFLGLALLGALLVWNVWRPRLRPAWLGGLSWICGYAIGEFALHWLALDLLLTAGFAWGGAFETGAGLLGLAVGASAWLALLVHYLGGRRAAASCEQALREGYGSDYRSHIRPGLLEAIPTRVNWRSIARPFSLADAAVERLPDIPFAAETPELRLDVYRPRQRGLGLPVLLYVHGGAWVIGSKDKQGLATCWQLAKQGWLCVNADYRLSPRATFPDHIVDVKRAIRWVREHGAEYGADPDCIVITGGSAGAHLCALAALTPGEAAFQPGFEEADTRVQGCIPFYGVYDWTETRTPWPHAGLRSVLEQRVLKTPRAESPEAFAAGSPLLHVGPDAPPFFLIHGDADSLVPALASGHLHAALREAGGESAYALLRGAQHAFELFPSLRSQALRGAMGRFLALVRSRQLAADGRDRQPAAAS